MPIACASASTALFGSANARYLKRLQPKVAAINALESKYRDLSDEQLREQTLLFRRRLDAGESLDDLLVEMVELPDHPWFIACQFHPEFTSSPREGHPLFTGFVKAAIEESIHRQGAPARASG